MRKPDRPSTALVARAASPRSRKHRKAVSSSRSLASRVLTLKARYENGEPYRTCHADFAPYADDLTPSFGEDEVDRNALLGAFKKFLEANSMEADWEEVEETPTEVLVNTLCVLSPLRCGGKATYAGSWHTQNQSRNPHRAHRNGSRCARARQPSWRSEVAMMTGPRHHEC